MLDKQKHLPRLPDEYYQGQAYVHWTYAIKNRQTGWLIPIFYYKFRELLAHTMFRHQLTCPIYCCMPDHIHLHWIGIRDDADQRVAAKYFRRHLNAALGKLGVVLQRQPFDHVLKEEERERDAFEAVVEYIARNPERKKLVPIDDYHQYKYTGCLVPGHPELILWQPDFWDRFWRTYSHQRENGLSRRKS